MLSAILLFRGKKFNKHTVSKNVGEGVAKVLVLVGAV
jgi:hypothetical protein